MKIRDAKPIAYGALLGIVCFCISATVAVLLYHFGFLGEVDDDGKSDSAIVIAFFSLLVVSPAIETLLMLLVARTLMRFLSGTTSVVIVTAIMSAMHSAVYMPWGFIILIPFALYSIEMTRRFDSIKKVFLRVFTAHFVHNLIVFALMVYSNFS